MKTATAPMTAFAVAGLAAQMANALASVPFRRPWEGPEGLLHNLGISVTRTVMRAFLGYATSLPTAEFRSLERLLDGLCRVVLPPFVGASGVTMRETAVGGIAGWEYRPRSREPRATVVYLHGGGYIGTSPVMYAVFTARLAHETGCAVFVPDYRLAPEFPFPYSLHDAAAVYEAVLAAGVRPARLFVGGDSAGGGLANALVLHLRARGRPRPAGLLLFSPEVSLTLDEPSITENAPHDILPWNVPVRPYLRDVDPRDPSVAANHADLHGFPPTFAAVGGGEMFRDAIRHFAARLEACDVEVCLLEEPGMFHAFPLLMPWADASERVFRAAGNFVTARLARAGRRTAPAAAARR